MEWNVQTIRAPRQNAKRSKQLQKTEGVKASDGQTVTGLQLHRILLYSLPVSSQKKTTKRGRVCWWNFSDGSEEVERVLSPMVENSAL